MSDRDFALVGAAGYVAPRHMDAIKKCGGDLVAAFDPRDSVGVLDQHFPDAHFFVEFERFDRHLDKLRRTRRPVSYVSVCSPNYLHDSHIRFGLRSGADVICEKPLVLNPWNLDAIERIEEETGHSTYAILQLRHHPAVVATKQLVCDSTDIFNVELRYITPRGRWYDVSWKGDEAKSGGIATNIGIHLFDMLLWTFGKMTWCSVESVAPHFASGTLTLERANVHWILSTDRMCLPSDARIDGKAYRSMTVDGKNVDFSGGFNDLHTTSYREILAGRGCRVRDARPAIELVHYIRSACRTPRLLGGIEAVPPPTTPSAVLA